MNLRSVSQMVSREKTSLKTAWRGELGLKARRREIGCALQCVGCFVIEGDVEATAGPFAGVC